MPLTKTRGNMYDWVSHKHTHLAGECPHKCKYCYVQKGVARLSSRYKGKPRLIESELNVNYGINKIIFIEHMHDLFARSYDTIGKYGIEPKWIEKILKHCRDYPDNKYVFQTKNVDRLLNYFVNGMFPSNILVGTTIETNRDTSKYSNAPQPPVRFEYIAHAGEIRIPVFVTIEPIMDFDIGELSRWILDINPKFVNVGADSKKCNLPEPPKWKINNLINLLKVNNIIVKKKSNLERLLK